MGGAESFREVRARDCVSQWKGQHEQTVTKTFFARHCKQFDVIRNAKSLGWTYCREAAWKWAAPLAFPFVFSPQATSAGSSSLWKVGCPKECQHSLYFTSVPKEKVIYGERSCLSFKKKEVKHGFPELSWPNVWPCTIIWPVRQIPSRIKLKIWIIIVYLPHLGYFGIKWYDTCKMFGTPSGTKKKPSKC